MKKLLLLSIFAVFVFVFNACQDESLIDNQQNLTPDLPDEPYDYVDIWNKIPNLRLPESIPNPTVFTDFPIIEFEFGNEEGFPIEDVGFFPPGPNNRVDNNDIATLGRVLFYDTKFSKNNTISCASCHHQEKAFADDVAQSIGFGGKATPRNSMSLANPVLNTNMFWDSRVQGLENLISEPVTNHIELGIASMEELADKLQDVEYYDALFLKAYGDTEVTSSRISDAVAQFVGSMYSGSSKFDHGVNNNFADFSELEKYGMAIFFSDEANCSACHAGANFAAQDNPLAGGQYSSPTVAGTANIGLEVDYEDEGRGEGKFRIPSLRNIALTGPYMHDGRFETLKEVIGHYNEDIAPHLSLDDNLKAGGLPKRMNLSTLEITALESFLRTLTDEDLVSNPMYSNPFRN